MMERREKTRVEKRELRGESSLSPLSPPPSPRILVVKLSDIGDVLTATPALRALRHSFPRAVIDVLLPPHSAPVLEGSPLVDEVLVFDKFRYDRPFQALRPGNVLDALRLGLALHRRGYDHLVILHHLTTRWGVIKYALLALVCGAERRIGLDNGRGWFLTDKVPDDGFGHKHEVEYCLEVVGKIGASSDDQRLEIAISAEDEAFARRQIPEGRGPTVIIHPGSGGFDLARRWSAAGFAQVADALAERYGAYLVLVGKEDDGVAQVVSLMRTRPLNLAEKTTLKQLAALLRRGDLFIGADSGVMHTAVAAGVPVVAIFGPSNHAAWGPWIEREGSESPLWADVEGVKLEHKGHSVLLRADLPCCPCSYVGFAVGTRKDCQAAHCMEAITPALVLRAAELLLAKP
jgi:ADP-heptose:LPS heptosyltransferase